MTVIYAVCVVASIGAAAGVWWGFGTVVRVLFGIGAVYLMLDFVANRGDL